MKTGKILAIIVLLIFFLGMVGINARDPKDTLGQYEFISDTVTSTIEVTYDIYVTIGNNPEFLWKHGFVGDNKKDWWNMYVPYTTTKMRVHVHVWQKSWAGHKVRYNWDEWICFDPKKVNGQKWYYKLKNSKSTFFNYGRKSALNDWDERKANNFNWGWGWGYSPNYKVRIG